MPIQKAEMVRPAVKAVTQQVKKAEPKSHRPMNSFEFQAGFIPESKPMGGGTMNNNERIDRILNLFV